MIRALAEIAVLLVVGGLAAYLIREAVRPRPEDEDEDP